MPLIPSHNEFKTYSLNDEGFKKSEKIKDLFDEFLTHLEILCIPGREFSIVKTKLEEACFFAKKSMCTSEINQK